MIETSRGLQISKTRNSLSLRAMKLTAKVFLLGALVLFSTGVARAYFLLQKDEKLRTEIRQQVSNIVELRRAGKPRNEIAQWVTDVVDARLRASNRSERDERGAIPKKDWLKFDRWRQDGIEVDDPWAATHWAWQNRLGQCNESAYMAYHLLIMGLQSSGVSDPTEELRMFTCGEHVYLIWGVPSTVKKYIGVTKEDFLSWNDAWIIDPWVGVCGTDEAILENVKVLRKQAVLKKQTEEELEDLEEDVSLGWERWFPTTGTMHAGWTFRFKLYEKGYTRWLYECKPFEGVYFAEAGKQFGPLTIRQKGCYLWVRFGNHDLQGEARGEWAYLDQVNAGGLGSVALGKRKAWTKDRALPQLLVLMFRPGDTEPLPWEVVYLEGWPKAVLYISEKDFGARLRGLGVYWEGAVTEDGECVKAFSTCIKILELELTFDMEAQKFTGLLRGKLASIGDDVNITGTFKARTPLSGRVELNSGATYSKTRSDPAWTFGNYTYVDREGKKEKETLPLELEVSLSGEVKCQVKNKVTGKTETQWVLYKKSVITKAVVLGTFNITSYDPGASPHWKGWLKIATDIDKDSPGLSGIFGLDTDSPFQEFPVGLTRGQPK